MKRTMQQQTWPTNGIHSGISCGMWTQTTLTGDDCFYHCATPLSLTKDKVLMLAFSTSHSKRKRNGSLWANSPFGWVTRIHARASHERRHKGQGLCHSLILLLLALLPIIAELSRGLGERNLDEWACAREEGLSHLNTCLDIFWIYHADNYWYQYILRLFGLSLQVQVKEL